jgi:hypothetical protein
MEAFPYAASNSANCADVNCIKGGFGVAVPSVVVVVLTGEFVVGVVD